MRGGARLAIYPVLVRKVSSRSRRSGQLLGQGAGTDREDARRVSRPPTGGGSTKGTRHRTGRAPRLRDRRDRPALALGRERPGRAWPGCRGGLGKGAPSPAVPTLSELAGVLAGERITVAWTKGGRLHLWGRSGPAGGAWDATSRRMANNLANVRRAFLWRDHGRPATGSPPRPEAVSRSSSTSTSRR